MELVKDLPEVFEEFAEQRKNSFLGIKKIKEQGMPVIGSYCTYFPQEIAMGHRLLLYIFSTGDRHGDGGGKREPLLHF